MELAASSMCLPIMHTLFFFILKRDLTRRVRGTSRGHVYSNCGQLAMMKKEQSLPWRESPMHCGRAEGKSLLFHGEQRIQVSFYFPVGPYDGKSQYRRQMQIEDFRLVGWF